MMKKTKSAGAILISRDGKVAIVSNRGRSWGFPKGHIEPNETAQEAMFREVMEETGVSDTLLLKELGVYSRPLIGIDTPDDLSEMKEITMFLCLTNETELHPRDPDNPVAFWVDPEEVTGKLTHAQDRQFYEDVKTDVIGIAFYRID